METRNSRCATRVRVIKSPSERSTGACTIIALPIFVIAESEVNGVILPLVRANREIVTMRSRHYPSVGSLELMSVRLFRDHSIDLFFLSLPPVLSS